MVLFQLGGPDSLEAVEPFLRNLFLDPDIIPMGPLGFLRNPLAKLISAARAKKVQHHYSAIGGASPIRRRPRQRPFCPRVHGSSRRASPIRPAPAPTSSTCPAAIMASLCP